MQNCAEFMCPICNRSFQDNDQLMEHVKCDHIQDNQTDNSTLETSCNHDETKCQICQTKFISQAALAKHMKTQHQEQYPYNCMSCPDKFEYQRLLKKHVSAVHSTGEKTAHICYICSKNFAQKSHLKNHVKIIHQKEKPFQCFICDFSFGSEGNLYRHVQIVHDKIKKFQCDGCYKSFGQKSHVVKHAKNCFPLKSTSQSQVVLDENSIIETPKFVSPELEVVNDMSIASIESPLKNEISNRLLQDPLETAHSNKSRLSKQMKNKIPKTEVSPTTIVKSEMINTTIEEVSLKLGKIRLVLERIKTLKNDSSSLPEFRSERRNESAEITLTPRSGVSPIFTRQSPPIIPLPPPFSGLW